jgi:hypothetical protein
MKVQTDFPRLTLRLPQDLMDKIKSSANDNERSINAEVIARLTDSFNVDSNVKTPEIIVDRCQTNLDVLAAKIAEKVKHINALEKVKSDK